MKPQLIFAPPKRAKLKKSRLYAWPMLFKTLGICSQFLKESLTGKANIEVANKYVDKFWRNLFQESHTTLIAYGREHIDPKGTYVFMSNHESLMDIPALFGAIPTSLRMVAKEGLMRIPIFGHAMENAGFIPIDRKNRYKAISQLEKAKHRLAESISIWISPEGTRTRSGTLAPFKKGGFYLATQFGKPIVPCCIVGAKEVLPPDSILIEPNRTIAVFFGTPISTHGYQKNNLEELVHKVRAAIVQLLEKAKAADLKLSEE